MGKLKTAVEVLREHWLAPRVSPNRRVFDALAAAHGGAPRKGFDAYLRERPALGRIAVTRDWHRDPATGEMRLEYSNSLFAEGCLRIRPGRGRGILAFLPGNLTAADEVLGSHPTRDMTRVADEAGMALACWDWPLQGRRLDRSLYVDAKSLYTAEREYSRFLPSIGTSLWREFVGELAFALDQVRRQAGAGESMHVAGWSMGACFAYLAPLLSDSVASTIAGGSCARIADLIAEGETRQHGYWFYPLDGLAYFDLDDVVDRAIASKRPVRIIHGDEDRGCLARSREHFVRRSAECGGLLTVDLLARHGHVLSPAVKALMVRYLRG